MIKVSFTYTMQYGTFVIGLVKFIDHDPHWYTREVKKSEAWVGTPVKAMFSFFSRNFLD